VTARLSVKFSTAPGGLPTDGSRAEITFIRLSARGSDRTPVGPTARELNAGGLMRNRRWMLSIAALMAAVALVGSAPRIASSQVVPRPKPADTAARRIKIKKDSAGGEVCLPGTCASQAPSVATTMLLDRETYAREAQRILDSIETEARVRSAIAGVERRVQLERIRAYTDSVARAADDREAAALTVKRHLARGFYVGLAGGTSMPQRDIRNGYTNGWNTTIPVGWDADNSPLGIRGDFSFDRLHGTELRDANNSVTAASGDISVWSLNLDAKLRVHAPGAPSRTNVYVLGGIGGHRVANGVYGAAGENAGNNLAFADAKTKFGWNVGAGVSTQWAGTEIFVESRFVQIRTDMGYHMNGGVGTYTSFTPIVIGLQWF
jgi:opacity protein-like surface antigen